MALDFRERSSFNLMPARIISRDSSTWWSTIRINRGFEDGVEADMPVVTDLGVVGKTTTVSKNEAIVVLVTDETCRIGARIDGTREQGIITGLRIQEKATEGLLQMNFLSKNAKIEPGQQVLTAGVAHGSFPPGLVIGRIKEFRLRALDGQAVVEPAVQLASVEDVFVLIGKK
jgi:rod shape-determining protein MreC